MNDLTGRELLEGYQKYKRFHTELLKRGPCCGKCGETDVTFYLLGISSYGPWGLICLDCEHQDRENEST